jgi:hypothetical protein
MGELFSFQCSICLMEFKNEKCFKLHKCQLTLCEPDDEPNLEVRGEEEQNRLLGALMHSSQSMRQLLMFSDMSGTAVPGVAPLFFPTRHIPPIMERLGCTKDCYTLLRVAALEGPVKLRKCLKIKIEGAVIKIKNNLLPTSSSELKRKGLTVVDKGDHIFVYHISSMSKVSIGDP